MIKFPLYVTLDTNIFDSNKLDFSKDSTLSLLINYVETGKIKIVLSNIVVKEEAASLKYSIFLSA